MDLIKKLKPGVGDQSDLYVEKPSRINDQQTGRIYISKEGIQADTVEEGFVPTHIKYTPKCYGEVNLPLHFRIATELEINPLVSSFRATTIEAFTSLGTENFVVEQD